MPLFHFYLIEEDGRAHVGTMDLPSRGEAVPVGLHLVTKILAMSARFHGGGDGLSIEATDDAGALIYSFDVSRRLDSDEQPSGYLH